MVVRNLRRAAEKNERFAYLGEYEMAAVDERTLTITTPEVYPTMMNDLASPELAIMDLALSPNLMRQNIRHMWLRKSRDLWQKNI